MEWLLMILSGGLIAALWKWFTRERGKEPSQARSCPAFLPVPEKNIERAEGRAQEIKEDVVAIEQERGERVEDAGGGPAGVDVRNDLDLPPLRATPDPDAGL